MKITIPHADIRDKSVEIVKVWIKRRWPSMTYEMRLCQDSIEVSAEPRDIARIEMLFEEIRDQGYPSL